MKRSSLPAALCLPPDYSAPPRPLMPRTPSKSASSCRSPAMPPPPVKPPKRRSRLQPISSTMRIPNSGNLPLAATAGLPNLGGAKLDVASSITRAIRRWPSNWRRVSSPRTRSTRCWAPINRRARSPRRLWPNVTAFPSWSENRPHSTSRRGASNMCSAPRQSRTDYARAYMRFFADMKNQGKKIDNIAIVNENTDYGTSVGDAHRSRSEEETICRSRSAFPTAQVRPTSRAQVLQLKQAQSGRRYLSSVIPPTPFST